MPQLPVILTAFANSYDQAYLSHLEQEHDRLQQILSPLSYLRHIALPSAKTGQLVSTLTQYQQELLILHFGGHADGSQLHFKDAGGQIAGLAENLSLHPQLKLVFLNGCNTQAHALQYLEAGVPAVIATTCSVADGQAMQFAEVFYTALAKGHTLEEAFVRAKGAMKLSGATPVGEEIVNLRGVRLRQEQVTELPWRLYVAGDESPERLLNFRLTDYSDVKPNIESDRSISILGNNNMMINDISNSTINIGFLKDPTIVMPPEESRDHALKDYPWPDQHPFFIETFDATIVENCVLKSYKEDIWEATIETGIYKMSNQIDPVAVKYHYIQIEELEMSEHPISVEVKIEAQEQYPKPSAGIISCFDPLTTQYYAFIINNAQEYHLWKKDVKSYLSVFSGRTNQINPIGYNKLGFIKEKNNIYLFVNDKYVKKIQDSSLQVGDSGIIAVSTGNFFFDNLAIYSK